MAVRDDVIIDWNQSPRLVTVQSPSVYIGMLDLYQTLRYLERRPYNLEKDSIVNGFGQFYLDPQQDYGRIVQLQNAQLKFEDRAGPSWVDCTIEANLTAVDENGDPIKAYQNASYVNVVQYLDGSAVLLRGSKLDTILDRVLEQREKNIRRFLVRATADDPARNVSIGDWDHEVVVVKADDAVHFGSPVSTAQRKVAYEQTYIENPNHDRPFFYVNAD